MGAQEISTNRRAAFNLLCSWQAYKQVQTREDHHCLTEEESCHHVSVPAL